MGWEDKFDYVLKLLEEMKSSMREVQVDVKNHGKQIDGLTMKYEIVEKAITVISDDIKERDRESRRAWRDILFRIVAALSIGALGALLGKSL